MMRGVEQHGEEGRQRPSARMVVRPARRLLLVLLVGREDEQADDEQNEGVGCNVDLIEHQQVADLGQSGHGAELQRHQRQQRGDRQADARLDMLGGPAAGRPPPPGSR